MKGSLRRDLCWDLSAKADVIIPIAATEIATS